MQRISLRKPFYILALVGIDVAAFTLAFFCSVKLRIFLGHHVHAMPLFSGDAMRFEDLYFMPILFVLIFVYEGLYRKRVPFIDELKDILKSLAMLTIILFALISVGKLTHLVSRLTILFMPVFALLFLGLARYWGKIILHRLHIGTQNLLIIGEYKASLRIKAELLAEKTLGYTFCGFVPIDTKEKRLLDKTGDNELYFAGDVKRLPEILREAKVECALIAAPNLSREKTGKLADSTHHFVQHVLLIPEMRSAALLNAELYHLFINQLFLIKMRNTLSERAARFSKLAFDYFLVILALPIILPLLLFIGLLVRRGTPGPALYTQVRVGQHGREIRVFKFRSMYADADVRLKKLLASDANARKEWNSDRKLRNDPRVTTLGTFLRKTSLDELPQLINVLKGEMSLVGPRPVPLAELQECYAEKADYYMLVRPGMTGLWQISGRNDVTYEQRVEMDAWYIFNWSLYIDLVILYKTLGVVLKRRGAY